MCIRDRALIESMQKYIVRDEGLLSLNEMLKFAGVLHDIDCLLYTSDAADERSSVDLGGRRIIKKKKIRKPACMSQHDTHTQSVREEYDEHHKVDTIKTEHT